MYVHWSIYLIAIDQNKRRRKKGYGFPSFKTVDLKYTAENKITYYAALQIFLRVMYTRLKYVEMNKNTPQTIKNLFLIYCMHITRRLRS